MLVQEKEGIVVTFGSELFSVFAAPRDVGVVDGVWAFYACGFRTIFSATYV